MITYNHFTKNDDYSLTIKSLGIEIPDYLRKLIFNLPRQEKYLIQQLLQDFENLINYVALTDGLYVTEYSKYKSDRRICPLSDFAGEEIDWKIDNEVDNTNIQTDSQASQSSRKSAYLIPSHRDNKIIEVINKLLTVCRADKDTQDKVQQFIDYYQDLVYYRTTTCFLFGTREYGFEDNPDFFQLNF